MDDFLNALRFLTRIPVPGSRLAVHANSPAQVPWYAMVGLVVGIILSVWAWLLGDVPPMLQAALVLVVFGVPFGMGVLVGRLSKRSA